MVNLITEIIFYFKILTAAPKFAYLRIDHNFLYPVVPAVIKDTDKVNTGCKSSTVNFYSVF